MLLLLLLLLLLGGGGNSSPLPTAEAWGAGEGWGWNSGELCCCSATAPEVEVVAAVAAQVLAHPSKQQRPECGQSQSRSPAAQQLDSAPVQDWAGRGDTGGHLQQGGRAG